MTPLSFLGRGWNFPLRPDQNSGGLEYVGGRGEGAPIDSDHPRNRARRADHAPGVRLWSAPLPDEAEHDGDARARCNATWSGAHGLGAADQRAERGQSTPGDDPALVLIEIFYVHKRDGRKDNLVYPFYLE